MDGTVDQIHATFEMTEAPYQGVDQLPEHGQRQPAWQPALSARCNERVKVAESHQQSHLSDRALHGHKHWRVPDRLDTDRELTEELCQLDPADELRAFG